MACWLLQVLAQCAAALVPEEELERRHIGQEHALCCARGACFAAMQIVHVSKKKQARGRPGRPRD